MDRFAENSETMEKLLLLLGYVPLTVCIIVLWTIVRKMRKSSAEQNHVNDRREEDSLNEADSQLLKDEPLSTKEYEMEDLKDRLCDLMERERLYLNPNIRVTDVAERLYTNKSYLSQAIRLKLNKNFCQLLHSYRVQEAMRLYSQNMDLTIAELCRKVGFNSMTTFTQAFGRNTGCTPADWCKQYKRQKANEKK